MQWQTPCPVGPFSSIPNSTPRQWAVWQGLPLPMLLSLCPSSLSATSSHAGLGSERFLVLGSPAKGMGLLRWVSRPISLEAGGLSQPNQPSLEKTCSQQTVPCLPSRLQWGHARRPETDPRRGRQGGQSRGSPIRTRVPGQAWIRPDDVAGGILFHQF